MQQLPAVEVSLSCSESFICRLLSCSLCCSTVTRGTVSPVLDALHRIAQSLNEAVMETGTPEKQRGADITGPLCKQRSACRNHCATCICVPFSYRHVFCQVRQIVTLFNIT